MVIYSGGAKGADTFWEETGRLHGITTINYTVKDYERLSAPEVKTIEEQYKQVTVFLKRGFLKVDTYGGKLVRRDMMQANSGEVIYAVGALVRPGYTGYKGFKNNSNYSIVEGGTAYAVVRGILDSKPVYVFNQDNSYGHQVGWYFWNHVLNDFSTCTTVSIYLDKLTCIGSTVLNDAGKQAIISLLLNRML